MRQQHLEPILDLPYLDVLLSGSLMRMVGCGLLMSLQAAEVGEDSDLVGYDGIVDLTQKLNTKFGSANDTQAATVRILTSLMPGWLYELFQVTPYRHCSHHCLPLPWRSASRDVSPARPSNFKLTALVAAGPTVGVLDYHISQCCSCWCC